MKLKRLDIHGFKSFYHRTTVVFDDGITAVVGPNGCGKSNIVDSIKWVMGEQGAKSLRGASMEDVVFAGSEKRGPMGMCEVRLTFLNDGSAEVPARWQSVDEIAIERRLERSKGSDYLVNKQRCRLADIQDLLAGSGISGAGGQRAYAIIEQGQIGKIVSAKADERRLLIEEAAGITRYRARKRLAERKMDETRQNLERVDDIIGEVERQLRSLSRQAKKAERFREYRAEVREIGLRLAAFDYLALQTAVAQQDEAVRALTEADNDTARALGGAEARRAATALAEKAADEQARVATDALRAVEQVAHDAKGQLQLLEREAQTLMRQLETARSDLELGAGRRAELEGERAASAAAVTELEAASEGQDADLAAREEAQRLASRRLLDAKADAERLRREAAEEAHQLARARAQRDTARARALDLRERAAGLAEERGVLEAQRGEQRARVEADTRALAEAEQTIAAARTAQAEADARRQAAEAEVAVAVQTERALSERIAGLRSRLLSLEELERKREGLGEGNKAVLEAGLEGVVGTVPDALEVPAELEAAVAAALDARLGAVLVRDLAAAGAAVDFLRERGRGRGLFASAAATAPAGGAAPPGAERLVDRVPAGAAHPGLVRRLLGDTLVVDDLDAALALAATWDGVIVTLDGARVEGGAVVTGGAQGADPAPLSRRREIKGLEAEIGERVAEREAAAERESAARGVAQAAREAGAEAGRRAQQGELARAEARKDLQRAEDEVERIGQRLGRLSAEVGRLNEAADEAEGQAQDAAERLADADDARDDRARALQAVEEAVEAAEAARDEAMHALHLLKTGVVARRERLDAARAALRRIERQVDEVEERTARAGTLRGDIERRLGELAEQRVDAEHALAGAKAAAEKKAGGVAALKAAHQEAEAAHRAADEALERLRGGRERGRDSLNEARLALQGERLRLENLGERVRDRWHQPIDEVLAAYAEAPPPSAEDRERLDALEQLIERMGDVNVNAIEEYEEVGARAEFLTTQRDDLVQALDDLTQAIEQINRTSKTLFKETFEAVNARFQVLFPRLFRGGDAELVLTDPEDLLETGIEMLVRPPGKKVQNVTLLSGGEKAMCAIALVFAVFQVKPSPFCLLDEVDAPLDDANIGRFNEIVREMAQTSQILLITHNKRTMEIADVLYGITMEESGVSKLVSVRMT